MRLIRFALGRTIRTAFFTIAAVGLSAATALAQPDHLASAETFAVLSGSSLSNTGATTVSGDVGVGPGGSISGAAITVNGGAIHDGDAVAAQALLDASEAYDGFEDATCDTDLTGQNLGGMNLVPGVYCFDGDATLSGAPLTLSGGGPWIFQIAGSLTTSAAVLVAGSTATCDGSSAFWQVGDSATIGAGTAFVGSILAQSSASLGAGATVDGRVIALDETASISLDTNAINACSFGEDLPAHPDIKVTGGGQIRSLSPLQVSTYGFNAKPEADDGASGHLNYLNHISGLHIVGEVTDVAVVTINEDGSPDMVRFSGTCQFGADCTFSVTVEDNGEPPFDDRFGIAVVGSPEDETTPDQQVAAGNIQFHSSLVSELNAQRFRAGDTMAVSLSLVAGKSPPPFVDAFLVLQLPNGQLLSWTPGGLVPGIVPLARSVTPVNFRGVVAQLTIPAGVPAGSYTWYSALTSPGTMNLLSEISSQRFTIGQ